MTDQILSSAATASRRALHRGLLCTRSGGKDTVYIQTAKPWLLPQIQAPALYCLESVTFDSFTPLLRSALKYTEQTILGPVSRRQRKEIWLLDGIAKAAKKSQNKKTQDTIPNKLLSSSFPKKFRLLRTWMIGFTVSLYLVRRFKMPLSSGTHNNKAIAGATYQKSKDVFTFPSIPRAQVLLKPVDHSHETFPLDSAGALLINPLCRFACVFLTYIMQAKILKYTEIN